MGRYEEALPLYLKALTIIENSLGRQHESHLRTSNNLALLYKVTGRYELALPLYLQTRD